MNEIERKLLEEISSLHEVPKAGVYNIRKNGKLLARGVDSEVNIVSKRDKDGIDIIVKKGIKGKSIHIPVIVSEEGYKDKVYNDFYIGDNSEILIVAGCGVHNNSGFITGHNGIHTFHIGDNCKVRYVEKHIGIGKKTSKKVLDPVTAIEIGKNSKLEMETTQIGGVTSSKRVTTAKVGENSNLIIKESLLTENKDKVRTVFNVDLVGENSKVEVISRSVAKDNSHQDFVSNVKGKSKCFGHVECDGILSGRAVIASTPKIIAQNKDAILVHEAAIGKISEAQQQKLMTLGLTKEEAEQTIISGFLK